MNDEAIIKTVPIRDMAEKQDGSACGRRPILRGESGPEAWNWLNSCSNASSAKSLRRASGRHAEREDVPIAEIDGAEQAASGYPSTLLAGYFDTGFGPSPDGQLAVIMRSRLICVSGRRLDSLRGVRMEADDDTSSR